MFTFNKIDYLTEKKVLHIKIDHNFLSSTPVIVSQTVA